MTAYEAAEIIGREYFRWCCAPIESAPREPTIDNSMLCDRMWTVPIDLSRIKERRLAAAMSLLAVQTRRVRLYERLPIINIGVDLAIPIQSGGVSLRLITFYNMRARGYECKLDVCGWEHPAERTDTKQRLAEWRDFFNAYDKAFDRDGASSNPVGH